MQTKSTKPAPPKPPFTWDALPPWVRSEVEQGRVDLEFYQPYLQRLADHSENMKPVWRLLDKHREVFGDVGPVAWLLKLLHWAKTGPDPGSQRSAEDRRYIADDVRKHVDALTRSMDRLATDGGFGMYPFLVADRMYAVAHDTAADRSQLAFQDSKELFAHVDDGVLSTDGRQLVLGELESIRRHVEAELADVFMDPRHSLRTLAEAVDVWARGGTWSRNDVVGCIGSALREWFGGNHPGPTATLASAILDEEISADAAAGVLRRRPGHSG